MIDERIAREQDYWDASYTDSLRTAARKYYGIRQGREAFYERLVLQAGGPGRRALELGAHTRGAAFSLARAGTDVTGIDISEVAVEQANDLARAEGLSDHARFQHMNAEELGFPDRAFDVVCGTAVIHHLALDRAMPEVARVMKPDGQAVFTEPLGHNPVINLYRRRTPSMRTVDEHPLLIDDLRGFRRHFGGVEVEWFHLTSLLATPLARTPALRPVLRGLEALDRQLFRIPALQRQAWYVVVRLTRPRTRTGARAVA